MLAEFGPRPPVVTEPMVAAMARSCRFHARAWCVGAVHRGARGDEEGWVLLCAACVQALNEGTLTVIDTAGRYQGSIPAPDWRSSPFFEWGLTLLDCT